MNKNEKQIATMICSCLALCLRQSIFGQSGKIKENIPAIKEIHFKFSRIPTANIVTYAIIASQLINS